MTKHELNDLLDKLCDARIGVLGDFCLDAYWTIDLSASEISIETGLSTRPVRQQRYSLGGAGTILNNLVSIGVGKVLPFGVVGNDLFGREMRWLMNQMRVADVHLLTQPAEWDTMVYAKPIRNGAEEPRLDFGNFNRISDETAAELLRQVEQSLRDLDTLIINEQMRSGLHSSFFQAELNALMVRHSTRRFIVDCRHCPENYRHCIHKMNAREAARLCGYALDATTTIPSEKISQWTQQLFDRWKQLVFVTDGARGCFVADASGVKSAPAIKIDKPVDPVGAGDSFLAAVAAGLTVGSTPFQAAEFGNLVAGITVQKLLQTGTASPNEIRTIRDLTEAR